MILERELNITLSAKSMLQRSKVFTLTEQKIKVEKQNERRYLSQKNMMEEHTYYINC